MDSRAAVLNWGYNEMCYLESAEYDVTDGWGVKSTTITETWTSEDPNLDTKVERGFLGLSADFVTASTPVGTEMFLSVLRLL